MAAPPSNASCASPAWAAAWTRRDGWRRRPSTAGSTEFAVGAGGGAGPDGVVSVDVGCVRVTEKFLHSDPPAPEELSQTLSVVRDHLDDVAREIPATLDAPALVGLAGTVTTIAAI